MITRFDFALQTHTIDEWDIFLLRRQLPVCINAWWNRHCHCCRLICLYSGRGRRNGARGRSCDWQRPREEGMKVAVSFGKSKLAIY